MMSSLGHVISLDIMWSLPRLAKSVNVLKDLVQYAMSLVEEEEQEVEEEEVWPHPLYEYH